MKRIKLLMLFVLITTGVFAQGTLVNIGATVTNTLNVLRPNQPITVIDSTSNPANTTVHNYVTDANGQFSDSLFLTTAGTLHMFTMDSCNTLHLFSMAHSPNTPSISWQQNIVICTPGVFVNCNFGVYTNPTALGYVFSSGYQGSATSVYTWSFGDGTSAVGGIVTHAYAQPGTYIYCVAVDSCTVCDTLVVGGGPANCDASFGWQANGFNVLLTPAAAGGSGVIIVHWGDGTDSQHPANQTTTIGHSYSAAATYSVCVEHVDANCSDTVCLPVTVVQPNPMQCNASFIIDTVNSQPGTVYVWNMSGVTGASPNANISFAWDFGDGGTSNLAYPTHFYQNPGTYTLCLTMTAIDSTGFGGLSCTSTYCDSLTVDQNGNIVYKGAIMGWNFVVLNPDNIGIEEGALAQAKIYPNPAREVLHIALPETVGTTAAQVYSINGSLLAAQQLNSGENTIDIANLPAGMYVIHLKSDGATAQIKFVKY